MKKAIYKPQKSKAESVSQLISLASAAKESEDALRFSQAALNVAQALKLVSESLLP